MSHDNKKKRPKIAVIGTGTAAFGVLTALLDKRSDFDIVVYDIGKQVAEISPPDNPSEEWIISFYDKIYKDIRSLYPFKFPPPKTHFGEQIPRHFLGQHIDIFKSESFGGLTNYWGTTMLPLTDREMAKWPISKESLEPYYQKIAEIVGIAGCPDALNEYFIRDFSTRPPIRPPPVLALLNEAVNQFKGGPVRNVSRSEGGGPARFESRSEWGGQFKIISGLNRCAVETREDQPNHCLYCGECLAGCFQGALYSTRLTIKQYFQDPRVRYKAGVRVSRIKKNRSLEIETDKGSEAGFSKIFLAAGCPASTEIIMRSFGLRDGLTMNDNAVYVFPILYLGKKPGRALHKSYLSLCNIILGCIPKTAAERFAQVQIYPNFDYLWRYNIPAKIWPIIRPLLSFFRSRLFWGRLYLHSDYSPAYSLKLMSDRLAVDKVKFTEFSRLSLLMSDIRAAVNRKGFYIPFIPPIRQKVNSHQAGALPFGNKIFAVSSLGEAEAMPGLYLCDSTCLPDSPAINPAFTIMANACRIADGVLG